jgi:hypothetical protein
LSKVFGGMSTGKNLFEKKIEIQSLRTAKRIKFSVKSKMGEIYRRYTRPNLKLELSFS